jgi:hypothetical protein
VTDRLPAYTRLAAAVVAASLAALVLILWTLSILKEERYETGLSTVRTSINNTGNEVAGEITSRVVVSQSFVATRDDLSEVSIQLATYNRVNTPPVVFTLSRTLGSAPLRTIEVPPEGIDDNTYHKFSFEPISDSAGQRYFVSIGSPQGRMGNAFTVWMGKCDCYGDGDAFINGVIQPDRELVMQVVYSIETGGVGEELVNRMSQYKPEAVKGLVLVLTAFAAAALAALAVGMCTRRPLAESGQQGFPWAWVAASVLACLALVPIVW